MDRDTRTPASYLAYLLRLWQEENDGQLVWRASLEESENGKQIGFASLGELHGYLQARTGFCTQKGER